MRTLFVIVPILLGLMVAACGSGQTENSEAPIVSNDAGHDTSVTDVNVAPVVMCPVEGQLFCGEKCIDVSFDLDHCGACNNACTRGKMTCMAGECLCLGDGIMCDGACFDAFTSRAHCGSCTNSCSSDEACVSGGCVPIADDPNVLGVLVATNEGRAAQQDCGEHGLRPAVGPVQINELLTRAAQAHAEDMAANRFRAHTGSDGTSPSERAARAGYNGSSVGENVAEGYEGAEAVVAGWIASDGHCNNLMNGSYDELGVGVAVSSTGVKYWAQVFGAR